MSVDNPNKRVDIKFNELINELIKELEGNVEIKIKVSSALVTKWITKHQNFKPMLQDVKDKLEEILK